MSFYSNQNTLNKENTIQYVSHWVSSVDEVDSIAYEKKETIIVFIRAARGIYISTRISPSMTHILDR